MLIIICKRYLPAFLFLILVPSCKPNYNQNLVPQNGFVAGFNYLYGTDTVQQTLDYYLPIMRSEKNTPVIIFLHGGAWVQGNKSDFNSMGLDSFFTSYGFAVVNMNYRLDKSYAYPAPLDDIGMVMDLLKEKSAEWQINPNRVCLLGKSSGSHLALLYGYARNNDRRIKTVIDCSGPTNFTDSSIVHAPLGINVTVWLGSYANHEQLWHDASPIYYMESAVPTVIMQGQADALVLTIQAQMLEDSLNAHAVPNLYITWPNSGHGWNTQLWQADKLPVINWLKTYL